MNDERDKLDVALAEAVRLAQQLPDLPQASGDPGGDEALLRYLDDHRITAEERESLRKEVHATAWGRERLQTLREGLADVEQAEPPKSEAAAPVRLAFTWARDGLRYLWSTVEPRSLVAVPVATRGTLPDGVPEETAFFDFAHRFGDVDVVIQVERVPDDRMDVQLCFQGQPAEVAHLRVNLADRSGSLLDSQPVEKGSARFAALPPATHCISITCAQQELGRVLLDVHAA